MSSERIERSQPQLMLARTGARVALAHAAAVIIAFALAGLIASLALDHLSKTAMRDNIRGEAASLREEFSQKGADHLPYTVNKRQRLWRGFDYRLVSASGDLLGGRLPESPLGWTSVSAPPRERGAPTDRFLALTEQLPNGDRLTVGQNLAVEAGQTAAIQWTVAACGTLGVLLCMALSYLASRGAWRRIAAISEVAGAVSRGDLRVRATASGAPPRDDIDQLGLAFNTMLDRIGLLIAQVRQVSTDIAHDMRTPLTRHRQRLERLRVRVRSDNDLLSEVRGLESDVDEILRTFDALLQLSEIESVADESRAQMEDLAEVVSRVADAYRPDIEESGRLLRVALSPAAIWADEALLAQAVANLLENALRHTQVGAVITIGVEPTADGPVLSVSDNGPGIPPAQRDAVLRPFVRLEPSRQRHGSGLGLSIVAAIAARHGGRLVLEDAGPGLRVQLRFPTVKSEHLTPAWATFASVVGGV